MKTIEQDFDTPIEVRGFNKLLELQQDGVYITCDTKGAAELIKVLQEWVDEKH